MSKSLIQRKVGRGLCAREYALQCYVAGLHRFFWLFRSTTRLPSFLNVGDGLCEFVYYKVMFLVYICDPRGSNTSRVHTFFDRIDIFF